MITFPFVSVGISSAPYRPYPNAQDAPKFTITYRDDATPDMLAETLRHYRHAVACLRAGAKRASDSSPVERTSFGACEWPRVEIFGDVWVRGENGVLYPFTINICNEHTTAAMLVSAVWELVEGLGGESVLAEMFPTVENPRHKEAQEWADSPTPPRESAPVLSYSESGTAHLGKWDSKAAYTAYDGQTISFEVASIVPEYSKQGVLTHVFYPHIGSGVGKYPIYGMTVYSDNTHVPQGVKTFLADVTAAIVGNFRVVCRVAVKDNRCSYYVQKIESQASKG